jgi:hypothetical protein
VVLCFHFSQVLFENSANLLESFILAVLVIYQNLRCKKTTLCFTRRRWLDEFQVSPCYSPQEEKF